MKYQPVIGLEIHTALKTRTKMFCDSLNDPDEKRPNWNVCPVCMGHPGTLPVINSEAVNKVILTGLALNCTIAHDTFFERKNYFYPDLPKGYQISQYQKPLCEHGYLETGGKKFRITRIHLEEDAGRLQHDPSGDFSLVDYNRASVPLMELVTEPDFTSGDDVRVFAEEFQQILRYIGASDADMEKGLMRVEVNISVRNADGTYGTKIEIKNLNSITAAAAAIDYEIRRQTPAFREETHFISGDTPQEIQESVSGLYTFNATKETNSYTHLAQEQETRGWDDKKKETYVMRSKEEAHDYRYFPEPDLPPLHFEDMDIEAIRSKLPELPAQRRERFKTQYGLPEADVETFVTNKSLGNYFEHVASELGETKLYKLASNYMLTEYQKHLSGEGGDAENTKVTPEMFADLIRRTASKEISSSGAQMVLKEMFKTAASPEHIIKEKDLGQVSDTNFLGDIIALVISKNAKAVDDYKNGKEASKKFLLGMIMRESKGKADPQVAERMLEDRLANI